MRLSGKKPELEETVEDRPITLGQVGMWVFICTEIMFFAALISVCVILRLSATGSNWPGPELMHLSVGLGVLNTVMLVISGVTAFAAANFARSDRPWSARLLLLLTIALGSGFLVVKLGEYAEKYRLGLMPSASHPQIFAHPGPEYVSAVDQRLRTLIAEMEQQSDAAGLTEEERQRLDQLYELKTHMSGYTATFVGRSLNPHMQEMQMKLMAQQIYPNSEPTLGLEEILALDLERMMALQKRDSTRLILARQRISRIDEQIESLDEAVRDAALLGSIGDSGTPESNPSEWLEVKQEQRKQLNTEIERLELALQPVEGRIAVLNYYVDPKYEDGINAALGLRLPVVVTNGDIWMSVYLLLTGMHLIHLLAGLLAFFWFLPQKLTGKQADRLYVAAMYWQLVDVVWLAIFWFIYF